MGKDRKGRKRGWEMSSPRTELRLVCCLREGGGWRLRTRSLNWRTGPQSHMWSPGLDGAGPRDVAQARPPLALVRAALSKPHWFFPGGFFPLRSPPISQGLH